MTAYAFGQPLPDEALDDLECGIQAMKRYVATVGDACNVIAAQLTALFRPIAEAITRVFRPIHRRLLYLRRHGNHAEKQMAWRWLHPPQQRRLKRRRPSPQ